MLRSEVVIGPSLLYKQTETKNTPGETNNRLDTKEEK